MTPASSTQALDRGGLERVGTALADASRRRMLLLLVEGPQYPGEMAVALHLTKANVSNHLSCLRGCGLVTAAPEGRRVRYELSDPRLAVALRELASLALPPPEGCADGTALADQVADGSVVDPAPLRSMLDGAQ